MTDKKHIDDPSEKHLKELEHLLEKDIRDPDYTASSKFYLFRMGIRFSIYLILTIVAYLFGFVDDFRLVIGAVVFFILIELVRYQWVRHSQGKQKVSEE